MAFTPQPTGERDSRLVEIEMELSLKVLVDRETIPGCASLDVGRPMLTVRTMASTLSLALDQWHLVSGHQFTGASGGEGDFLLVLLRIQNVKELPIPLPIAPQ